MSNTIIEVNNLSKSYTISYPQGPVDEGRQRYTALRDVMAQKSRNVSVMLRYEASRVLSC